MKTLSVCLITKNEEVCIKRILDSLTFADEIIVYDTGSTDNTIQIIESHPFGVTCIRGEWRDDFAWARNQSFSYASCDYVMWVDADDIIDADSQEFIRNMKEKDMFGQDNIFLEYRYDMDEEGNYNITLYRERILNRNLNPTWCGRIHEYISTEESIPRYYIEPSDCYIGHLKHSVNPYRNIEIFKDMEFSLHEFDCREWCYYGNECWGLGYNDKAIQCYENCVNSEIGSNCLDKLNACISLGDLYRFKGDYRKAIEYYCRSFSYTIIPRADAAEKLGELYVDINELGMAREWFKIALQNYPDLEFTMGFRKSFAEELPAVNLCMVESRIGDINKSKEYNDMALRFNPNLDSALHNKEYFDGLE